MPGVGNIISTYPGVRVFRVAAARSTSKSHDSRLVWQSEGELLVFEGELRLYTDPHGVLYLASRNETVKFRLLPQVLLCCVDSDYQFGHAKIETNGQGETSRLELPHHTTEDAEKLGDFKAQLKAYLDHDETTCRFKKEDDARHTPRRRLIQIDGQAVSPSNPLYSGLSPARSRASGQFGGDAFEKHNADDEGSFVRPESAEMQREPDETDPIVSPYELSESYKVATQDDAEPHDEAAPLEAPDIFADPFKEREALNVTPSSQQASIQPPADDETAAQHEARDLDQSVPQAIPATRSESFTNNSPTQPSSNAPLQHAEQVYLQHSGRDSSPESSQANDTSVRQRRQPQDHAKLNAPTQLSKANESFRQRRQPQDAAKLNEPTQLSQAETSRQRRQTDDIPTLGVVSQLLNLLLSPPAGLLTVVATAIGMVGPLVRKIGGLVFARLLDGMGGSDDNLPGAWEEE